MKRLLVSCLTMLIWANSLAQSNYNFPGGIAEFKITKQSSNLPEVKFGLREPVIIDVKGYWKVLIGLDLNLLPGEYVSYIKNEISDTEDTIGEHKTVLVRQMIYPFVQLERTNTPSNSWPIRLEHEDFSDIDFANTQQPSLPLKFPFEGDWSNTFGHKMYDTNSDTLHVPNSITVTTTRLGTVVAPQSAIVSKIKQTSDGSYTVFLDHGRGLYSVISGLDDLTIEIGNGIVAGAVIGKLPSNRNNGKQTMSTKRLVWQTVLNGTYVNPFILTELEP